MKNSLADEDQSTMSGFHRERWRASRRGRHSRRNVTEVEPDTRKLSPRNYIKRRTKRLGGSLRKIKVSFSSLATQAEDAAASGNMEDPYDTTKKLAGKYTRINNQVKDKEGNILTREDEQLPHWVEHFSEQLNRPSPAEIPSVPEAPSELEVNVKDHLRDGPLEK